MISIIIPHYNSSNTLLSLYKTIPDSKNIEILIVDDRSDVQHVANIKVIASTDSRVIFLENHTREKGAGSCRNIALEHAKGDWILFADSDDVFIEDAFNIIDSYLLRVEDNNLDVVYFSPKSKKQSGSSSLRHLRYSNLIDDYMESDNDAIRYQFYVPWSKLIRAQLIKSNNIKFDEVIASNDVMFSALVGHYAKQIECTSDSIYCVIESDESLTKDLSNSVMQVRFRIRLKLNKFLTSVQRKDLRVNLFDLVRNYSYYLSLGCYFVAAKSFVSGCSPLFEKNFIGRVKRKLKKAC